MDTQIHTLLIHQALEDVAIRLAWHPWQWVRADRLFSTIEALYRDIPISKDAPGHLTVAIEEPGEGFFTANFADSTLAEAAETQGTYVVAMCDTDGGILTTQDLARIYLPLGFAKDVLRWRQAYGEAVPVGIWEDFRDEKSREAFMSGYVGQLWWVVYPPETIG